MSRHVKRVLYIDHTPFAGGAQLVLAEHITELDRRKFDPYVVCSNTVPALVEKYAAAGALVELVEFPRLRGLGIGTAWKFISTIHQLRHIIHKHQIDLVVSNTTRASYVAVVATLGLHVPVIWWVRDFLYPRLLFKLLLHRTAKVIFVSKAIQVAYMKPDHPKGVVVYVASSMYERLPQISHAQIVAEKKKWGIGDKELVVGFMGRLVADKGVEEVVDAAYELYEKHPHIKFLIVGTGKNQMHDVESLLQQKIKDYGLQDTVTMTGYQENEPLYYSLFDIFVLPTRDGEPFATSVVQAMMAGAAVIGSNAGGTPELINSQTGILFTPGSASELAAAILRLAMDDDLRVTLAESGKNRVLQYHRESVVTDQVESIFQKVLENSI